MQALNNELLNSLNIYFCSLSKFGYMNYSDVNKLIVVLFMGEILEGLFDNLIEEDDYKSITNAINCLLGTSCIIPYPKLNKGVRLGASLGTLFPRITEYCSFRETEIEDLRNME